MSAHGCDIAELASACVPRCAAQARSAEAPVIARWPKPSTLERCFAGARRCDVALVPWRLCAYNLARDVRALRVATAIAARIESKRHTSETETHLLGWARGVWPYVLEDFNGATDQRFERERKLSLRFVHHQDVANQAYAHA